MVVALDVGNGVLAALGGGKVLAPFVYGMTAAFVGGTGKVTPPEAPVVAGGEVVVPSLGLVVADEPPPQHRPLPPEPPPITRVIGVAGRGAGLAGEPGETVLGG